MNAIDMLKTDHKAIRRLFARFDALDAHDYRGQKQVVDELVGALHSHAKVEEGHFYPAVAKAKAEPKQEVQAASDEHEHMDKMVDALAAMDASDQNYRSRFNALRQELSQHMREEEREMFPAAKDALGEAKLGALGEVMAKEKQQSPSASKN